MLFFFLCTNQVSWIIKWLTDPGILNWVGQHQLEAAQGNHLKLICYATVTALALFLHNSWIPSLKDAWIANKPPACPCKQRWPQFLLMACNKDLKVSKTLKEKNVCPSGSFTSAGPLNCCSHVQLWCLEPHVLEMPIHPDFLGQCLVHRGRK